MLLLSKNLEPLRAAAMSEIDVSAGEFRKLFITSIPGQEMVYQQKRVEAELLITDPATAHATIPHIVAEASLNGIEPFDQAVIVLTMAEQWTVLSAQIEAKRLGAKAAVRVASNPAQIRQAAAIDWSSIGEAQ
ncbi:hypothetical protein [Mesorhizobium sp. INR15]|uniref:hypothetical protein n=1 Tax=Mesorhizobium sp. INR15 TaxID=2654248 RepID=UPI0018968697|nr:hypothetical protein [Mesorhizobium sp. INR15]QPC91456.1 hypothetical protein GA829_13015 [Mesorhizobium sp. INR15]